jgi:hypothetical protein
MAFAGLWWYWIAILLIGTVNVWAVARVIGQLRTHHPDQYDNLGCPSLLAPRSMNENWPFTRFLIRREYCHFGDTKLKLFGDIFFFSSLINIGLILIVSLLQLKH